MHIAHECSQVIIVLQFMYLLYGFSKFSILIGCQAVRKNPYPDRGPYFSYLDRIPGCRLSGGKFLLCNQKKFLLFNFLTPLNSTSLSFFTETEFDCRACHSHFKEWGDRCEWFTIENDSSVVCVD
jgi:hypothetical protein